VLYSERELEKRIQSGCGIYYFYSQEEALVRDAAQKTVRALSKEDPETTVLSGPTPSVEEIILAAGTISFFGGKRLVLMPLIRPSTYSDKDLQELCDTLSDTQNAIFVLTSVMEGYYGKLRPGAREKRTIQCCEKLGYSVEIAKPNRAALCRMAETWAQDVGAAFAPGVSTLLLDRCGENPFLLKNETDKLAALANYGTITADAVHTISTVTLDADTFDMVNLAVSGRTTLALKKLNMLLALQNDPVQIAGALNGNYLDIYRMFLAQKSRRQASDVAKDFGYTGNWRRRLEAAGNTAARFTRNRIETSMAILQTLDSELKGQSRVDNRILLEKALCDLARAGSSR
jgi:DNA polymerase-3 subunit delta